MTSLFANKYPQEQKRFEFLPTVIYVGESPLDQLSSANTWTIRKIDLDVAGNPTQLTTTRPYSAVWDDRATEDYG